MRGLGNMNLVICSHLLRDIEETCEEAVILKAGQTATEDEVRDFCKARIAHYKVPRYIKFVDAFPMTITGKIQKFVMRDQMKQELNLSEDKTA